MTLAKIAKTFIGRLVNRALLLHARIARACLIDSWQVAHQAIQDAWEVRVLADVLIDPSSRIGSYTYIGRGSAITRATIGRYCSFGDNVTIGPGEHSLRAVSTSALFYDDPWTVLTSSELKIGNDVWIGVNAIVLRGLEIGTGAVIAAGAVVTRSVPPFAIVAGVPARVIGYRFSEEQQMEIFASRWWELELIAARSQIRKLQQTNDNE